MINTAVISISDTRKADNDISGDKLAELVDKNGGVIIEKLIATDNRIELEELLRRLADAVRRCPPARSQTAPA